MSKLVGGKTCFPAKISGGGKSPLIPHKWRLCVHTIYNSTDLWCNTCSTCSKKGFLESVKPKIKEEFDRMVAEGIIRLVDVPTDLVNSLVCVSKASSCIRLCLDRKYLNCFIKRTLHYTPTIDDVLPEMHTSNFFSIIDARSGYWNVPLQYKSKPLTTFNTPGFRRHCFERLPFGLISPQKVMEDVLSAKCFCYRRWHSRIHRSWAWYYFAGNVRSMQESWVKHELRKVWHK